MVACELSKDNRSSDLLQKIQAENKGVVSIATTTTATASAATVVARGVAHAGAHQFQRYISAIAVVFVKSATETLRWVIQKESRI